MLDCAPRGANRKYVIRMLVTMSFYLVATFISVRVIKHNPSATWKYAWALLPMIPAVYVPLTVINFLREIDELQRKIQLEALAFAFATSAVLTLSYGFLQNAGLPDLNWVWVWPVMGICWAIGVIVARWRYR
jgi:hypothetical protein